MNPFHTEYYETELNSVIDNSFIDREISCYIYTVHDLMSNSSLILISLNIVKLFIINHNVFPQEILLSSF